MIRKIVEINQEKCNGCGLCASACHEGAIQMVDGKARLTSESYCDGLGACLPACPTGAIRIVERDSADFVGPAPSAPALHSAETPHVCPGSAARALRPAPAAREEAPSELGQWPVQIKLVNVNSPFFRNCDLLIAADCTAYAYAAFHRDFIRGRVTLVGCPKLDDNQYYTEKLADIFAANPIHSVTVVRMEVPCCGGIVSAVKKAMLSNSLILPYHEVVISVDGQIVNH